MASLSLRTARHTAHATPNIPMTRTAQSNQINSFELVDGIFVRDSRSRIRLKKIFDFNSELIPDVAFILKKYIKFANYTRSGTVIMPFDYYTYDKQKE